MLCFNLSFSFIHNMSSGSALSLYYFLLFVAISFQQELTEFPIMAIRAEKEIKRFIPPRTGTLTLVVVDGFTLKVWNIIIVN